MSLIDQIKSNLTDAAISKLSGFVGADESTVKSAVNAAIPSLIGGVSNAGNSAEGATGIFNTLKGFMDSNSAHAELNENSDLESVSTSGTNLLGSLLGNDKVASMTNAISAESGLASGGVTKLLGALAPMVMGTMFKGSGDSSNFLSYLTSAGAGVAGLLTGGLGNVVSGATNIAGNVGSTIGNVGSTLGSAASTVGDGISETSSGLGSLLKKILPILLLLAALFLLWTLFNKGCKSNSDTVATTDVDSASMTSNVTTDASATIDSAAMLAKAAWETTLGALTAVKLPNGTEIQVPANGDEMKLINFLNTACKGDIKTTWFNMDRLLFKTGSSELNEVSMDQINNLNEILKAYGNATFKIGGYTDNVGNPASNKKLSGERATSVLNALVTKGSDAKRLEAEGYGQEHPACPANDTDECKAKNRRVSIRVTKCN